MKLEIVDRKRNALMKREEAMISIEHGGKATPNRKQILDEVSKLFKARLDTIIIDRIITQGGRPRSDVKALVYSKKDDIPAWRLSKMEQRMAKKKEEEKPPEAPPAEKPEEKVEEKPETPSEESKEEKPEEKPQEEKPTEEAGEKPAEPPIEGPTEEEKPEEEKKEEA
jgi:ribosomal protein S24E